MGRFDIQIRSWVRTIRGQGITGIIARGVIAAFLLFVLGVALRMLLDVAFARVMGASAFGAYSYLFSWITVLAILGTMGMPVSLLRFVPEYQTRGDGQRIVAVSRFSRLVAAIGGLITGGVGMAVVWWFRPEGVTAGAMIVAIFAVPALAVLTTQTELARAMGRMVLAYFPHQAMRPAVTLLVAAIILATSGGLDVTLALIAVTIALGIVATGQWIRLRELLPRQYSRGVRRTDAEKWIRVGAPLLLLDLSGLVMFQGGIIIVGGVRGADDAGLYAAALRISLFTSFIMVAINTAVAPMLAKLYFSGAHESLARLVKMVARLSFLGALAAAVIVGPIAGQVLAVFGSEFPTGARALQILLVGQLAHASVGPVDFLMTTTGHQGVAARALACAAVLFVIAGAGLGYRWGIEGVALAAALSRTLWATWLAVAATRRLNVRPFIM